MPWGRRQSAAGVVAWYGTDDQGSVRDLLSTAGTMLDHLTYSSYGQVLSESSPSTGDRYKYTGAEYQSDTQFTDNENRWYNTVTGRWLTTDPKGFAAGNANLCRCVTNDPTNLTDPSGLQGQPGAAGATPQQLMDAWKQQMMAEYQRVNGDVSKMRLTPNPWGLMGNSPPPAGVIPIRQGQYTVQPAKKSWFDKISSGYYGFMDTTTFGLYTKARTGLLGQPAYTDVNWFRGGQVTGGVVLVVGGGGVRYIAAAQQHHRRGTLTGQCCRSRRPWRWQ